MTGTTIVPQSPNAVDERPWQVPPVLPGLVLAAAGMFIALTAPLELVPTVLLGSAIALARTRDHPLTQAAGAVVLMVLGATLLVQTLVLRIGVGTSWSHAFALSSVFGVRLAAVLLAATALSATIPTRRWLAALGRWPRIGLVVALAMRQVPEVSRDVGRIHRMRRARGLLVGGGRFRPDRLAMPVIRNGLARADRMGAAMTLSGWTPGARSRATVVRWRATDVGWILVASSIAALGFLKPW